MRAFTAHLWKEWREHRLMLAAIAGAIVLLVGSAAWIFADQAAGFWRATSAVVGGGTALTVLALGTEVFAAEGRRDGFAFLRRTPGALRAALFAKGVFYVGACVATAVWSTAVFLLATSVVGGSDAAAMVLTDPDLDLAALVFAGVVTVGLWILTASLWIPRGAAAAGAALLLLAALAAPVALALRANPAFRVPEGWARWTAVGLIVVPAVAAAWGLLRGLRFGRGSWAAAWRGLVVVFAAALPAYAAGGAHLARWNDLRSDEPNLEQAGMTIGHGGAFAYVNLGRPGETCKDPDESYPVALTRAFRVDLRTGATTPMAPLGSYVQSAASWFDSHGLRGTGTSRLVAVIRRPGDGAVTWWDAERGVRIKALPRDVVAEDLVERVRADLRDRTSARLPDGRPAWILRGRLEHDGAKGEVVSHLLPATLGVWGSDGYGWYAWDETLRGSQRASLLVPDAEGKPRLLPRPRASEEWLRLQLTNDRHVARGDREPWVIVEGGERRETSALERNDSPIQRLDATSLLAWRRLDREGRTLVIADVAAGTSSVVPLPPGAPEFLQDGYPSRSTPSGRQVFGFQAARGYGLFDPATRSFVSWTPRSSDAGLAAVLDETRFLELESDRRLFLRTFGSTERRLLWSRP